MPEAGTAGSHTHASASKLAQLLGEVIVQHAPWTAEIDHEARWRHTNAWLEGLEQHTAGQIRPFLTRLLEVTDPPAAIRGLIDEALEPTAQFGAVLEQVFLYGIVSSIIGAAVQPFLQGVINDVNTAAIAEGIHRPVDPSTIATAAGRGLNLGAPPTVNVPDWAYEQARMNGIDDSEMDLMASLIGLPPALQELFELYRRGVIGIDEVKQGLREGDFRDDWIDRAVQLAHSWLTPLDFVRAAVQAQMTYGDAKDWAKKTGLDVETPLPVATGTTEATPDMFGLAFSIAGRPPGPEQLGRMALRGIIPWEGEGADATTFQQGIAESDVKTKWTAALQQLMTYFPPPSAVGSLLERGAITKDQAIQLWKAGGVPDALAQGYAYIAEQQHIGQDKLLARTEVTTGYYDRIFDRKQAIELLGLLGYRDQVAEQLLDITDFRREIRAIDTVVTRVQGLYIAWKLDAARAKHALIEVGVPAGQADELLHTWETLRIEPIRLPTTREIGLAVKSGTITQDEGLQELARLGYQPRDAAIVLSSYAKVDIKPLPPPGTTVTG